MNAKIITVDKTADNFTQTVIKNSSFWVDIDLKNLREIMRIDSTVTTKRLEEAVMEAMATVNQNLSGFKDKYQAKGYANLQEIESEKINGVSVLTSRYTRAVYYLATAFLYERFSRFDSTKEGSDNAETLNASIDNLKRDAQNAIRDIKGDTRVVAELI